MWTDRPVYGLCDCGRGFRKKVVVVDHDAKNVDLSASRIFPAFYYHRSNGRVDLVLTTHVDDFLWACTESGQVVMDKLYLAASKSENGRSADSVSVGSNSHLKART